MAEAQPMPLPEKKELVTEQILTWPLRSTGFLTVAFGGNINPSSIWVQMIMDSQIAYWYYRELEEKDDDVAGPLETLKMAVLSREALITPSDESQQAMDVAAFIQQQFDRLPNFAGVLNAMLAAPGYGVAINEILYDVSAGQVGLIDIKDCPQEIFSFATPGYPQIGPLRLLEWGSAAFGVLVPESKFLIYSYRPRARIRRGEPLLRSVFWPSWFKRQALRFELRFAEKGPGTAAVKYPQGATADEQAQALAAAEAIIEKIAVAVPSNFELVPELLKEARAQNPKVYEDLASRMELKITRRILGQTLTTRGSEEGAGSRALGQVHEETFQHKVDAIAGDLEAVVMRQLVRPLVMWNFGPGTPPPRWSLQKGVEKDLVQSSQVDQRLQQMGLDIPVSYVRDKYSVPELKEGDEALVPRPGAAPVSPAADAGSGSQFSESALKKNLADVQRIEQQLRAGATDVFRRRIRAIATEFQQGGAR